MKLQIIAVGQKMPGWIDKGFDEYARRMPRHSTVILSCIATAARKSGLTRERIQQQEAQKIRAHIKPGGLLIALDEKGQQWSTQQWANEYRQWLHNYPQVDFVIGGPDGLLPDLLKQAGKTIALGKMTLPHGLARVVLMEQLYRIWSLHNGHPYHRE